MQQGEKENDENDAAVRERYDDEIDKTGQWAKSDRRLSSWELQARRVSVRVIPPPVPDGRSDRASPGGGARSFLAFTLLGLDRRRLFGSLLSGFGLIALALPGVPGGLRLDGNFLQLGGRGGAGLVDERPEVAVGFVEKLERLVELGDFAGVHDKADFRAKNARWPDAPPRPSFLPPAPFRHSILPHPRAEVHSNPHLVGLDDGIQSVGYGVRRHVDRRSRLIQDKYLRVGQDCTSDAEELELQTWGRGDEKSVSHFPWPSRRKRRRRTRKRRKKEKKRKKKKTSYLSLSQREIFPVFNYGRLKPVGESADFFTQVNGLQRSPDLFVRALVERVQICPDRPWKQSVRPDDGKSQQRPSDRARPSREQKERVLSAVLTNEKHGGPESPKTGDRVERRCAENVRGGVPHLRDDRDLGTEIPEADGADVEIIDGDFPFKRLHDAQEGDQQGGFTGAGAADDADFFLRVDRERDVFEDGHAELVVLENQVGKLDGSGGGPVGVRDRPGDLGGSFARHVVAVVDELPDGGHLALDLADHPDRPLKEDQHLEGVGQRQTGDGRHVFIVPVEDDQQGAKVDHQRSDDVEVEGDPGLGHELSVQELVVLVDLLQVVAVEPVLRVVGADREQAFQGRGEVGDDRRLGGRLRVLQLVFRLGREPRQNDADGGQPDDGTPEPGDGGGDQDHRAGRERGVLQGLHPGVRH
ncbi:MAG: hypothetical protein BJ554DRAFT_6208, partial [Olpidium bornovanus]